jgi:hypothetical protein
MAESPDLLASLQAIVGPRGVVTEPQAMAPYLTDWRGLFHRRAEAVVRPVSTEEVAKVVALCARLGLAITPQGGNTGMSGGATPAAALYHKIPGEPPLPPKMDPEHDFLMALEAWVEDNAAPEHIIASRYQDDEPGKPVVRTLPLCQFPAQARYQGSGDLNDGSSWSCPAGDQRLLTVGSFGSRGGL